MFMRQLFPVRLSVGSSSRTARTLGSRPTFVTGQPARDVTSDSSTTPSKPTNAERKPNYHPLYPTVETDELGLPVHPQRPSISYVESVPITRERLHQLHRLSALNPPPEGSEEETKLLEELGEIVALMDYAKRTELPEGDLREITRDLLGEGVGQVVLGPEEVGEVRRGEEGTEGDHVQGKELLKWATSRVGDYYASRAK